MIMDAGDDWLTDWLTDSLSSTNNRISISCFCTSFFFFFFFFMTHLFHLLWGLCSFSSSSPESQNLFRYHMERLFLNKGNGHHRLCRTVFSSWLTLRKKWSSVQCGMATSSLTYSIWRGWKDVFRKAGRFYDGKATRNWEGGNVPLVLKANQGLFLKAEIVRWRRQTGERTVEKARPGARPPARRRHRRRTSSKFCATLRSADYPCFWIALTFAAAE